VEAVLDGLDLQKLGIDHSSRRKNELARGVSRKAVYEAGSLLNSANISWKANGRIASLKS
jgi:hypothetical protein